MNFSKTSKTVLLPLSAAVVFLWAGIATGCWCRIIPPCEMFGSSDAVFIGKVVRVEDRSKAKDGTITIGGDYTFRLRVEKSFLGAQSEIIDVSSGGGNCSTYLNEGDTYLVYASFNNGKLRTNKCSRTAIITNAEEDLAFLNRLPREGSGARIDGSVNGYEYDPTRDEYRRAGLRGIPVAVTGDNFYAKIFTTSPRGEFELTGLKTGKYEIRVTLPNYYDIDSYDFENGVQKIEVNDRGCVNSSFFATVKNSVEGHVLDAQGRPLEGVDVTLIPASEELRKDGDAFYKTDTDKNGKYSLNHIAPGKYLLGISVEEDDGEDNDGFFYPGVASRLKATKIEFGFGRALVDYDIRQLPTGVEVK